MTNEIGQRIRNRRLEMGFNTQADFAKKCGINQKTLSTIETGHSKDPTLGKILPIAQALGVTVDWIVDGQEYNESIFENPTFIKIPTRYIRLKASPDDRILKIEEHSAAKFPNFRIKKLWILYCGAGVAIAPVANFIGIIDWFSSLWRN